MQPVSETYERIYRSGNFYFETRLVIGEDGVLITENAERILFGDVGIVVASGSAESGFGENMLISVKTTRRVFKNNLPEVGCCPVGEIYVEMHMPKGVIERKALMMPFIRLVSTEDGSKSEWLQKGRFYIDTRDNTHNDDDMDILSVHGYDAMMRAEVEYGEFFEQVDFVISEWTKSNGRYYATVYNSHITADTDVTVTYTGEDSIDFSQNVTFTKNVGSVSFVSTAMPPPNLFGSIIISDSETIAFPSNDYEVAKDIANKMKVEIDPRTIAYFESVQTRYEIQYPSGYTMREVLGYIGAMHGGNWIMNDVGYLQLINLWDLPEETNLLTDELGYRLVFGDTRIMLTARE